MGHRLEEGPFRRVGKDLRADPLTIRNPLGIETGGPPAIPDRKWIGAKVFADPAERAFLESVTHPEVARLRREATADPRHDYVVEIPLLFEKDLTAGFTAIVVVACSDDVRRARLRARGLSDDEISARIASQLSLVEKVKRADVVIWNDGEPAFLSEQVRRWVGQLRGA